MAGHPGRALARSRAAPAPSGTLAEGESRATHRDASIVNEQPHEPLPRTESSGVNGTVLRALLLAGIGLALFWSSGWVSLGRFRLDMGSIGLPPTRMMFFHLTWILFGGLFAGALAWAIARRMSDTGAHLRFARAWTDGPDRQWVLAGSLMTAALVLFVRAVVLKGQPLTDDESAYRFMAELLARGRTWIESPPDKLFFDRGQMANGGRYYSQYFLGWPALLAPGVWLGLTGAMNALYSALTVPALFGVLRRLAGSAWARAGIVVYALSPMLLVGAGTGLSHTSCLFALAWTTWFALRSREEDAAWWVHAGVGGAFAVAFAIRPLTALGIGLPLLVYWFAGVLRRREGRVVALVAFTAPAAVCAVLFLVTIASQTGSPLLSPYQATYEYSKANGFRFSAWHAGMEVTIPGLRADGILPGLARAATGQLRLNTALFGWPISLLFAFAAGWTRAARLPWACFACFFVLHLPTGDAGVDTFAPVHHFELAWPVLLLTAIGAARWTRLGGSGFAATLPGALLASLLLANLVGYAPVRFANIARITTNIAMPQRAVEAAGIENAVVFVPRPYAPACLSQPARHFVYWWPLPTPDFDDSVVWANHLTLGLDRTLLAEHFPRRRGYILAWSRECRVDLLPLEALSPGDVPDAAKEDLGWGLGPKPEEGEPTSP